MSRTVLPDVKVPWWSAYDMAEYFLSCLPLSILSHSAGAFTHAKSDTLPHHSLAPNGIPSIAWDPSLPYPTKFLSYVDRCVDDLSGLWPKPPVCKFFGIHKVSCTDSGE